MVAAMANQLVENISSELLSCKICFSEFSDTTLPKTLACPHTFCQPCISRMVRRSRAGSDSLSVTCPVCRKPTALNKDGAAGLSNNLTILTLMGMIGPRERQESPGAIGTVSRPPEPSSTPHPTANVPLIQGSSLRREVSSVADRSGTLGREFCVQCGRRSPEYMLHCGRHRLCDRCRKRQLDSVCQKCRRSQSENKQPSTRTYIQSRSTQPQHNSQLTGPAPGFNNNNQSPHNGATGTLTRRRGLTTNREVTSGSSTPALAVSEQSHPVPAPRHSKIGTPDRDTESPVKRTAAQVEQTSPRIPTAPARPPPFNPTYPSVAEAGASGVSIEVPSQIPSRSASPCTIGAAASVSNKSPQLPYPLSPRDPDSASLCSVASDSRLSPPGRPANPPDTSTLRRTQSMRRPPPPPQRSNYGTLQRRNLAPPPPPAILTSRSAENVRAPNQEQQPQQAGTGRQRHSLSEGSEERQQTGVSPPPDRVGVSPPVPPPRRVFNTQTQNKCVKRFGSYSEVPMQTSGFRRPSRIRISEKGDIVVTDTRNMTVQIFTIAGDYVSMFKVLGVQDTCFITDDKLCVASHMGVHVYTTAGQKLSEIHIGQISAIAPYKLGFIAATSKVLHVYRQSFTLVKAMSKFKWIPTNTKRWSPIHKKTQVEFNAVRDVAVTPTRNICVLDNTTGSNWVIYILTDEGASSSIKIDPASCACGVLSAPESLAVDFSNNVYIADTNHRRVLRFGASGEFQKVIVSYRGAEQHPGTRTKSPTGVAVTETGYVVVGVTGDQLAEIRIYSQVS